MFAELVPILKDRTITLTLLCLTDDKIHVMVFPERKNETENPALVIPFEITGTAEELDAELHVFLTAFVDCHKRLSTNLSDVKAAIDEASKEAKESAKRAVEQRKKNEQKKVSAANEPTEGATREPEAPATPATAQGGTTPSLFEPPSQTS